MHVHIRVRRSIRCVLLATFALLHLARPLYADAAPKWTDAQLVGFSDVILRGRVTQIAAGRDEHVGSLYTYVSLDVSGVLKGSIPNPRVTLKQLGGRLGSTGLQIAGQPTFTVGEDVLVFLEVRPHDRTLTTTALWQGKFTIVSGSSGEIAVREDPLGQTRGVFGDQTRMLAPWVELLRQQISQAPASATQVVEIAPPGDRRATPDVGWRAATAARWPDRTSVRVDTAAPGQPELADGGERQLRQAADFWTATGIATLATGGLQPSGCFTARNPDGRIVVGVDSCEELSPTGGTLAVSGGWIDYGAGGSGSAAPQFLGGGVITNRGETAARLLAQPGCFAQLAVHELGHALGLSHSPNGSDVMAPFLQCNSGFGTILPAVTPPGRQASSSFALSSTPVVMRPMFVPLQPAAAAAAAVAGIQRVSIATDGTQANGPSSLPALSADGRYVAFESSASNLVAGDTNGVTDIFVRDRATGVTTRESVGPGGAEANGLSSQPAISADGRYVAFYSVATNLVSGVTGNQIYVRDRVSAVTIVASVSTGGAPANSDTFRPAISGDGRYAGFDSSAANLVSDDTNGCLDIFRHDLSPGPTTRESVSSSGGQAVCTNGGVGSYSAALSGDGRYVAFASTATNLVSLSGTPPPCNVAVCSNVYVHDRLTGMTTVESIATNGALLNGFYPSISADGRYLVFQRDSGANTEIYLRDRATGQTTGLVSSSIAGGQRISADGRFVSYMAGNSITVYDRLAGQFTTIADGLNTSAVGGGVVAFSSNSALVVNDTNQTYDIFVAPLSAAPSEPTNLTYSLTGSTLTLTWTAPISGGAPTGYIIEAGSASGGTDVANFQTGSTATTFSAAVGGTATFYIRVRATNAAGTSNPSNEIVVVVGSPTQPPGAPSGLAASISGTTVTLGWNAPATGGPVSSYIIQAGSSSGAADLANFSTGNTVTSFTAAGVGPGTYFVRVRASNTGGISAPSNEVIVIVGSGCVTPGAPSDLFASVNGSTVTLTWTAGAGASSYELQVGSGPGQSDLLDTDLASAATTLTAVNVSAGTYFVRVRSIGACGQSAPSNEAAIIVR